MDQPLITESTLTELGIKIDGQEITTLLVHLNETLEERVGIAITDELDEDQLKTLLSLKETASEDEVGAWLNQNIPELQQITQDEIDILLGELSENSNTLNGPTTEG